MTVRQIMVSIEIDAFSTALVDCAIDLADRFDAALVGVCAAEPGLPGAGGDEGSVMDPMRDREERAIRDCLGDIENSFRAAIPDRIKVEWRGLFGQPNAVVARNARCADLIVTRSNFDEPNQNRQRRIDTGELLVRAGRPVIIAGIGLPHISAEHIVVGWKDCREARRAVVDALPLLLTAGKVSVATVHEDDAEAEEASLADVLSWMARQGVQARGKVYPATGEGAAETLEALAKTLGSDLLVTGGYGRGRMREWLFGGLTRDLLTDRSVHRFMSN